MASLIQTVATSRANLSLCIPKTPLVVNTKSSLLSTRRRRFDLSLKCNADYNNNDRHQVSYPIPVEIPWKKEICNVVQLIGTVGTAMEIRHFDFSKAVASTPLAGNKSSTDTTWVNLTFWDELRTYCFSSCRER